MMKRRATAMLTDKYRERIWNRYDWDGLLTPHVDTWRGAVPFGLLDERTRRTVSLWLLEIVKEIKEQKPAAYIRCQCGKN